MRRKQQNGKEESAASSSSSSAATSRRKHLSKYSKDLDDGDETKEMRNGGPIRRTFDVIWRVFRQQHSEPSSFVSNVRRKTLLFFASATLLVVCFWVLSSDGDGFRSGEGVFRWDVSSPSSYSSTSPSPSRLSSTHSRNRLRLTDASSTSSTSRGTISSESTIVPPLLRLRPKPRCPEDSPFLSVDPLCACVESSFSSAPSSYDPACVRKRVLELQESRHPGLTFYLAENGHDIDFLHDDRLRGLLLASVQSLLMYHCKGSVVIVIYSNTLNDANDSIFESMQASGYPIRIRGYDAKHLSGSNSSSGEGDETGNPLFDPVAAFWTERVKGKSDDTRDATTTPTASGHSCSGTDSAYFSGKYDVVHFSDMLRYRLLYEYGGTFNDVDSITIGSLLYDENRETYRRAVIGRSLASPRCSPAVFEDPTTACLPGWIGVDADSRATLKSSFYLSNGLLVGMEPESEYLEFVLRLIPSTYARDCECCLGRNLLTRAYGELYLRDRGGFPVPQIRTLPVTRMWLWREQFGSGNRIVSTIRDPFDANLWKTWTHVSRPLTAHLDTEQRCASGSYCDVLLGAVSRAWSDADGGVDDDDDEDDGAVSPPRACADALSMLYTASVDEFLRPSSSWAVSEKERKAWSDRAASSKQAFLPWSMPRPPSDATMSTRLFFGIAPHAPPNVWVPLLPRESERVNDDDSTRNPRRALSGTLSPWIRGMDIVLRLAWFSTTASSSIPMPMGGWIGVVSSVGESHVVFENVYNLKYLGGFTSPAYAVNPSTRLEIAADDLVASIGPSMGGGNRGMRYGVWWCRTSIPGVNGQEAPA